MGNTKQNIVISKPSVILEEVKVAGKYEMGLSEHTAKHFTGGIKRAIRHVTAGHHDLAAEELLWAATIAARDLGIAQEVPAAEMAVKECLSAADDLVNTKCMDLADAYLGMARTALSTHLVRA
jgi:hypothetical protein